MNGLIVAFVILAFVVLGPLAFIWCLNTLFNLGIAYTGWTWLAALGLLSVFGAKSSR